jgi:hypothetical protein
MDRSTWRDRAHRWMGCVLDGVDGGGGRVLSAPGRGTLHRPLPAAGCWPRNHPSGGVMKKLTRTLDWVESVVVLALALAS